MSIINKFFNFFKINIEEKIKDEKDIEKRKELKKNSFIKNFNQIVLYLKINEEKIKNKENITNSIFLKSIDKNIKVMDLYNELPFFINEYILKSNDTNILIQDDKNLNQNHFQKEEINILENFKNNILNVKLELFLNIENNLKEFKVFEHKIKELLNNNINFKIDKSFKFNDIENIAKLLSLSFYLYKIDINITKNTNKDTLIIENNTNDINDINLNNIDEKYLISLIEKTINNITNDNLNIFSKIILPSHNELKLLEFNDVNFNTGLEYEFWLSNDLFNIQDNYTFKGKIVENKINQFINLINLNSNNNLNEKTKEFSKIIEENAPQNFSSSSNKQYFEIITKKFNSTSEMLIFNDFILKFINEIKIKNETEISFSRFKNETIKDVMNELNISYEDAEEKLLQSKQKQIYDEFPGSIHFNISIPNIENINKLKFYLFLKDSSLMNNWAIRNDNVKDMDLLINIFGPHILNSKELDKLWQINFSYLNKPDKTGLINPRLEIRYMGGKDYPNKIVDINDNIFKIMECVKISMDNNLSVDNNTYDNNTYNIQDKKDKDVEDKNNEKYLNFLNNYDVDRNWKDLKPKEIELCFKFFNIENNIKNLEKVIKKFEELKLEIIEIKKGYVNGIKIY